MSEAARIDVSQVIDDCGINSFNLRVAAIGALVVLVEAYDITAMAFALPGLMKAWSITNAAILGPLLSASVVGMLIGSPLFGYLGDRFGRKTLIVGSILTFGVFTGLVLLATNIEQLFVLRLLAGLGLGGAAPNVISLVSEYAPARKRAMMVTVMYSAIGLGGALPGVVSSLLVADYGWASLFWVGTLIPFVVAGVALVWLPESAKYLVIRSRQPEALAILRSLAPERIQGVAAGRLTVSEELVPPDGGVKGLFESGLAPLTILFWVVTAGNFMTFTLLQSWTPALLGIAKVPPHTAALAQSTFQIGGVIGGAFVGPLLDKKGPLVMAIFLGLSVMPTVAIGFIDLEIPAQLFLAEFSAGFCILGTAYGIGAFSTMLYPTSIRANGSGWALGMGRLGSICSTVLIGILLGLGWRISSLFYATAVPLLISTAACFGLARLYQSRSQSSVNPSANIGATKLLEI